MLQCQNCRFRFVYGPERRDEPDDCTWAEDVKFPDKTPPFFQRAIVPIAEANPNNDCEAFQPRDWSHQ